MIPLVCWAKRLKYEENCLLYYFSPILRLRQPNINKLVSERYDQTRANFTENSERKSTFFSRTFLTRISPGKNVTQA